MTREKAKELLPIIQAWAEGKTIQMKVYEPCCEAGPEWGDNTSEDLAWGNRPENYRIKPEPRVVWLNEYLNGMFGHSTRAAAAEAAANGLIACHRIELPPVE